MTSKIKPFDVYGNTHILDEPILDVIATRLEARGRHPVFQRMLIEYLEFMKIDETKTVLDLGCGTGFAAREIAKRPDFKGHIIGIDISSSLIERAVSLAKKEGLSDRIEFLVGDSRSLDLAENSFDVTIAHTLISHLPDPQSLIEEMKRLVKPGGLVGIFDGDYASLTFSNSDPQEGKVIDELIINSIVTQPRVLRQLALMFNTAGMAFVKAFPYVVSDVGTADYWATSIESMRKLLPGAKAMTMEEADLWVDDRKRESEAGTFFASSNYYSFIARKPDAN